MPRPAVSPGRLLERTGDGAPRGMTVHDRTRLTGRLRHLIRIANRSRDHGSPASPGFLMCWRPPGQVRAMRAARRLDSRAGPRVSVPASGLRRKPAGVGDRDRRCALVTAAPAGPDAGRPGNICACWASGGSAVAGQKKMRTAPGGERGGAVREVVPELVGFCALGDSLASTPAAHRLARCAVGLPKLRFRRALRRRREPGARRRCRCCSRSPPEGPAAGDRR